ncbi:MAG: helix-turn-helix transcriptional regulator [Treponema sp.]|nr:helix-turn-helix transcriptional regulator [Treponema sp.]
MSSYPRKKIELAETFICMYYDKVMKHDSIVLTINRRIKQVREALKLSQVQFSRVISLSSGYLAGVEVEKRKANDRIIKLICSSFNVNETWLKTGVGEMFNLDPDEEFTKLVSLYKELDPKYQDYILKQIDLLLIMQDQDKLRNRI